MEWRPLTGFRRYGGDDPKLDLEDRGDTKATGEGEDTPKPDLEDREDIEATREGGNDPKLDREDRGDIKATVEGEDTPKPDLEDRGDIMATREGEETPKLDQVDREDIKATGYIKPVITKEEENPDREGDIREGKGSGNKYQNGLCLQYQAKNEEEEPKYQAGSSPARTPSSGPSRQWTRCPRTGW